MWKKILSREGVDITTISAIDQLFYAKCKEIQHHSQEVLFTLCHQRQFTHYGQLNMHALGQALTQKYFSTPGQIQTLYQQGIAFLEKERLEANRISLTLGQPDSITLLSVFQHFWDSYSVVNDQYSITSYIALEAWQADFAQMLARLIERSKETTHSEEIMSAVYEPWKKTAIRQAQEEMESGAMPEAIANKYQFLRSWSVVWNRPLDAAWAKQLVSPNSQAVIPRFSQEQVCDLLHPNGFELAQIELAPYMIFFKDWRDDVRREYVYLWSFLFDAMGTYFAVERNDIGYLSFEEIRGALERNIWPRVVVDWRKQHPVVVTMKFPEEQIVVLDQNIKKYEQYISASEINHQSVEVKGLAAQPGKAQGRVVIIKNYHDIKHVKDGDVLVTNTTHPNYLPGMQKAVAFVTNEGGIISHAAIVAREMKKPCIVGTKNATLVLQTGDLVEVDGNSGRVRLVK